MVKPSVRDRLRSAAADPRAAAERVRVRAEMAELSAINRTTRAPVVGVAPVAVSLTTFGHRVATVHQCIESIARGSVRPARLILWIDEADVLQNLPPALVRLQARGLEIVACPNYGPHKKQYPYAESIDHHAIPLVTADDDILYPRFWLKGLLNGYYRRPGCLTCFRAHRMSVHDGRIEPYAQWTPCSGTEPSFGNVPTGVSGVLYPPSLLDALREAGTGFVGAAPTSDDLWVHAAALRTGHRTAQVREHQIHFPTIPGTQRGTLFGKNVTQGGNDRQITSLYDAQAIKLLSAC